MSWSFCYWSELEFWVYIRTMLRGHVQPTLVNEVRCLVIKGKIFRVRCTDWVSGSFRLPWEQCLVDSLLFWTQHCLWVLTFLRFYRVRLYSRFSVERGRTTGVFVVLPVRSIYLSPESVERIGKVRSQRSRHLTDILCPLCSLLRKDYLNNIPNILK